MNLIYFLIIVVLTVLVPARATPPPTAYPLLVHVRSSQVCGAGEYLQAFIDGNNYELTAPVGNHGVLQQGDYRARLVKDNHKTGYELRQTYELLFPDQKTRKFKVTGSFEVVSFVPMTIPEPSAPSNKPQN